MHSVHFDCFTFKDLKGAANFMNESFTEIFEKYECGSTSTYKVTVEVSMSIKMIVHEPQALN